ncbi:MAG: Na(+)-translocating NADH-quinone reductase subunit C [Capnocytophaga sp.]|nr:Na(+)-translocating NADH-quinone reductase subunit C [Capnocytophaga sp.]
MSKRTDSNSYTVLFTLGMVVVVGALLAFVASSLRGKIAENERMEKQQNILYAMGVNENEDGSRKFISTDKVGAAFDKYIVAQYIIQNGKVTETDEAFKLNLKQEKSDYQNNPGGRKFPLFVGEKDGEKYYIIPVYGKGLWNAIWGYVSVDANMVVQGVFFDHLGETAGLGANIKERFFMDDFAGEHLLDDNGNFKGVAVAKGNADPTNLRKNDHKVDAIAGSTITGNGVTAMLQSDLKWYVPFFKNLKNEK